MINNIIAFLVKATFTNRVCSVFDAQFTSEKIEEEVAYFEKHSTFERTYGWAWLLKLQV